MVNLSSSLTNGIVRKGALGLALSLPLLAGAPVRAQSDVVSETETEAVTADVLEQTSGSTEEVEATETETIEVESTPTAAPIPVEQPLVEQVPAQPRVLISEVVIEGVLRHPEQERLELAAYDAMTVRPGSRVTRDELQGDLDAIYATGWFSDVRIEPINGPLGVKLVVQVVPNPILY